MSNQNQISRNDAIIQIIAQLEGPISFDEFTEKALSIWHSNAKKPEAGVRQAIRDDHLGRRLIFLDKKTVIPTHIGMSGARFRVPLSREEIKRGWLIVYPDFQFMMQDNVTEEEIQLVDVQNHTIPAEANVQKRIQKSIFGSHEIEFTVLELGWWYRKLKVKRNDNLLVTILDWETGRFRLEHEPARAYKRHRAEIQQRNQKLADALFDLLEAAKYEYVRGSVAVPTAYARLKEPGAYPADHWLEMVEDDSRMRWSGYEISYADAYSPLEQLMLDARNRERQSTATTPQISAEEKRQVYRFKAYLKHRKGLWRRIEIQGGQTLAKFNDILQSAFGHDFDHMGGFWKLVRRGNSRRFREVDLGSINPFSEGDGADVLIAAVGLKPGETMKYVYDFGDWIEHRLELEEIVDPEADAEYPRVVAQNRPRYRYCRHCKEAGQKTRATWICIECSNNEEENVLVCEDCVNKYHEDHYTNDILY